MAAQEPQRQSATAGPSTLGFAAAAGPGRSGQLPLGGSHAQSVVSYGMSL